MTTKIDNPFLHSIYEDILREALEDISYKIEEDLSDIKWKIFEEENTIYKKKPLGYCNIKENEICISTVAIRTYTKIILTKPFEHLLNYQPKNLLVDIVLDEVCHIRTKKDHGDEIYDSKLEYYHFLYHNPKRKNINLLHY